MSWKASSKFVDFYWMVNGPEVSLIGWCKESLGKYSFTIVVLLFLPVIVFGFVVFLHFFLKGFFLVFF